MFHQEVRGIAKKDSLAHLYNIFKTNRLQCLISIYLSINILIDIFTFFYFV